MQLRSDIDVGVASHTGPVRNANEDDYLILEPAEVEIAAYRGRLFAVADGMGGVAGGAEASRTAVRALGAAFLELEGEDGLDRSGFAPEAVLADGFARAAREVYRVSRSTPQLADMGTTLTALNLKSGSASIGHVGDSRCMLWRNGDLMLLTEDHAVEEPRHLLTRCLGAGRDHEEVDLIDLEYQAGDVFLLMTDGVWGVLEPEVLVQALRLGAPQKVADRLVEDAIGAGTTDNVTAMVVRVLANRAGESTPASLREVDLSAAEAPLPLTGQVLSTTQRRWPLALLLLGLVVLAFAVAKLVFGFDPFGR